MLAAIVAATRRMVEVRAAQVPLAEMERRAAAVEPRPRRVRRRSVTSRSHERDRRVQTSFTVTRRVSEADYDPVAIASGYDSRRRGGNLRADRTGILRRPARSPGGSQTRTDVPILRKDFIVDRYQILEARAAGADAILLIVAALTPPALHSCIRAATEAGLDVLVEMHDLFELPRRARRRRVDCRGQQSKSADARGRHGRQPSGYRTGFPTK